MSQVPRTQPWGLVHSVTHTTRSHCLRLMCWRAGDNGVGQMNCGVRCKCSPLNLESVGWEGNGDYESPSPHTFMEGTYIKNWNARWEVLSAGKDGRKGLQGVLRRETLIPVKAMRMAPWGKWPLTCSPRGWWSWIKSSRERRSDGGTARAQVRGWAREHRAAEGGAFSQSKGCVKWRGGLAAWEGQREPISN